MIGAYMLCLDANHGITQINNHSEDHSYETSSHLRQDCFR